MTGAVTDTSLIFIDSALDSFEMNQTTIVLSGERVLKSRGL